MAMCSGKSERTHDSRLRLRLRFTFLPDAPRRNFLELGVMQSSGRCLVLRLRLPKPTRVSFPKNISSLKPLLACFYRPGPASPHETRRIRSRNSIWCYSRSCIIRYLARMQSYMLCDSQRYEAYGAAKLQGRGSPWVTRIIPVSRTGELVLNMKALW